MINTLGIAESPKNSRETKIYIAQKKNMSKFDSSQLFVEVWFQIWWFLCDWKMTEVEFELYLEA